MECQQHLCRKLNAHYPTVPKGQGNPLFRLFCNSIHGNARFGELSSESIHENPRFLDFSGASIHGNPLFIASFRCTTCTMAGIDRREKSWLSQSTGIFSFSGSAVVFMSRKLNEKNAVKFIYSKCRPFTQPYKWMMVV